MNGSTVKKPHLIQNGILIQCNTENFVPIVVPDLSSSSSASSSTSRTLSRQEIHYLTSSSSSYSSHTTTASSDSETRVTCWKDDKTGTPMVCCQSWLRCQAKQETETKWKGNPDETGKRVVCCWTSAVQIWNPGVAARIQKKYLVDDKIPAHGDSHSSVSHEKSLGPVKEPKIQGPHAEDAMAEP